MEKIMFALLHISKGSGNRLGSNGLLFTKHTMAQKKLLEETKIDILTLDQQMEPLYLPICGKVGNFELKSE